MIIANIYLGDIHVSTKFYARYNLNGNWLVCIYVYMNILDDGYIV